MSQTLPLVVQSSPMSSWDPESGWLSACANPTLAGFLVIGLVGALAAGRGKRAAGVLDGLFGGWMGCALGQAVGVRTPDASALFTLAGAWVTTRIYEG